MDLVEAPCFSRGELDFSPAERESILKWALAPGFLDSGAKARHQSRTFPGALKRSFPRINAGAFTKKYTPKGLHSVVPQPVKPVSRAMARCIAEPGLFMNARSFWVSSRATSAARSRGTPLAASHLKLVATPRGHTVISRSYRGPSTPHPPDPQKRRVGKSLRALRSG